MSTHTEGQVGWWDDRKRIDNARQLPFRNIAHLQLQWQKGSKDLESATGWFIGPRTLITTAHSLYSVSAKQFYDRVSVIPAHNEGMPNPTPYKFKIVEPPNLKVMKEYEVGGNEHYDIGAIILPEPFAFGANARFFDFGNFGVQKTKKPPWQEPGAFDDASGMKGMQVYFAGYPVDKSAQGGALFGQYAKIGDVARNLLIYDVDPSEGQSGGPLWVQPDATMRPYPVVVGIHKGAHKTDPTGKSLGLRFDAKIMKQLEEWRAMGTAVPYAEGGEVKAASTSSGRRRRAKPKKAKAKAAAKPPKPPEPPKEVEGAYVIESESSDVVHVLHDCPGLQNATNPVDTRRAGSLADVTPVLREMGRPLCAICLDRLTVEHREAVSAAIVETAAPALGFRVEEDYGVLTIDRDGVRVWARYADQTIAFRLDQLEAMEAKGPTLFQRVPSLQLTYDGGGFFKKRVNFLFDDATRRDASFDQADAVVAALLEQSAPPPPS